jgi:superfamily II DNA or RNA helicase
MASNSEPLLFIEIRSDTRLTGDVKKPVLDELNRKLIFPNPVYEDKLRRGYWTGNTPEHLNYIEKKNGAWTMPRGFTRELINILTNHDCVFAVNFDKTRVLKSINFTFQGKLRKEQNEAAKAILNENFSVIQLPTGAGKTVVALFCIANRKQPALVIVHTKELLYQWRDAAKKFLRLKDNQIGLLGDGYKKIGEKLTIATIQTLRKMAPEVSKKIGFLVVDECHHVPAKTFTDTVSQFDCRYMVGLSATPKRNDGLAKLIHLYLGDLAFKKGAIEAQKQGIIMQPTVYVTQTDFGYQYNDDYSQMISALAKNAKRNEKISKGAAELSLHTLGTVLVVSDRKEHCMELANLIRSYQVVDVELLTGDVEKAKRKNIVKMIYSDKVDILVATASLIGEGFDYKNFAGLVLATPIKSAVRLEQIVGRIRRTDNGKEPPVIYDYLDKNGVLVASYRTRFDAYKKMGIKFG